MRQASVGTSTIVNSGEMTPWAPFYVDTTGSITCGGEVTLGAEVQLMMGSKESAIEAAKISAKQALETFGTAPKAALIFNCHVRDILFASRDEAKKGIDAIQSIIGPDVSLVDFYIYAKQVPFAEGNYNIKICHTTNHNETSVILLLGE